MELQIGQTKLIHTAHSSWGEGVFRGFEGKYLLVEFEGEGIKKFLQEVLGSKLLSAGETAEVKGEDSTSEQLPAEKEEDADDRLTVTGCLIQLDGEQNAIGGKNVISAFEGEDTLLFNESYTVVGSTLRAGRIHAMYDLTVIGDLDATECLINGALTVIGNVNAVSLRCAKACIIQGDAVINKIYAGGGFIANSVKCDVFSADENAIIQTTIDINRRAKIEKTIVACEGIIGAGAFAALNAIANEYFEFDGKVSGNVLELETNTSISEMQPAQVQDKEKLAIKELVFSANKLVETEYKKCRQYEEEQVLTVLKRIETEASSAWINGPCNERLFKRLIDISYKGKIETVEDYLCVLYAKKTLPKDLYKYETIEFVDSLLPDAEKDFDSLEFCPGGMDDFIAAIEMAQACTEFASINQDELLNKLFEAIGLKYNTVKNILLKNKSIVAAKRSPDKNSSNLQENDVPSQESVTEEEQESREDFLKHKLSDIAEKNGIYGSELARLSSVHIRTCGEFIALKDEAIIAAYGRKAYLSTHLIQVKNKMAAKAEEMI